MTTAKHPDDLQDRDILTNMDAHRGAGVQFGDFICHRNGDTPINFIGRVKGEYRAWYDRKEAEARREARASEVGRGEGTPGPVVLGPPSKQAVQEPEASLEQTIRSKVDALTQRVSQAEAEYRQSVDRAEQARRAWYDAYAELRLAEKILKELQEQDGREYPPEAPTSVGNDLPTEVGQRRKSNRNRVRKSVHSERTDTSSTETPETDTARTGV